MEIANSFPTLDFVCHLVSMCMSLHLSGVQVQRMWWWRSHDQRQRIGDSDLGPPRLSPPRPACDPQQLHKPNTDELRRWGAPARDWGREEKTQVAGSLSTPLLPHISRHTITWDALEWVTVGWSLGDKTVSENSHISCGCLSNVVFFLFFLF